MSVTADLAKKTMMLTTDQTRNIRSEKLEGKKVYERQIYKNQNAKAGYAL